MMMQQIINKHLKKFKIYIMHLLLILITNFAKVRQILPFSLQQAHHLRIRVK
jgi:hypothetical protein